MIEMECNRQGPLLTLLRINKDECVVASIINLEEWAISEYFICAPRVLNKTFLGYHKEIASSENHMVIFARCFIVICPVVDF
jgi:hypothetical protein